jgi:NIPSNAP
MRLLPWTEAKRGSLIGSLTSPGRIKNCRVKRHLPQELLMIIEMRTYKTKPGRRAEFLDMFRRKSVPAHDEIGMKILGPFLSIEDPDTFFFMRGFPDLESREPMKAKFYEGELWKNELESIMMPMLEKYDVVLVDDPDGLVRW